MTERVDVTDQAADEEQAPDRAEEAAGRQSARRRGGLAAAVGEDFDLSRAVGGKRGVVESVAPGAIFLVVADLLARTLLGIDPPLREGSEREGSGDDRKNEERHAEGEHEEYAGHLRQSHRNVVSSGDGIRHGSERKARHLSEARLADIPLDQNGQPWNEEALLEGRHQDFEHGDGAGDGDEPLDEKRTQARRRIGRIRQSRPSSPHAYASIR